MTNLLNDTIQSLLSSIENAIPQVQERFTGFIERFDKTFPRSNKSEREIAEAMVYTLMRTPLFLYAFGMHGAVVIGLHSIVERLTLEQTARRLGHRSTSQILERILERQTLPGLADVLCELGVLDRHDLSYVGKLNRLRNSAAHRNPRTVSNTLLSGKKVSFLDIDRALDRVDCCDLIIRAVRYVPKLARQ